MRCLWQDNQQRFLLFNKAALKALEVLPFSPGTNGVIVANDWHTAILPVLVKVKLSCPIWYSNFNDVSEIIPSEEDEVMANFSLLDVSAIF